MGISKGQGAPLTNLRGEAVKNRYAFIDALKVVGILLVLAEHLAPTYIFPATGYWNITLGKMYELNLGSLGVTLFLLASGCSLYLTHPVIDSKQKLRDFYLKRALRIYPAYWMAIVFAFIWQPWRLQQTFTGLDVAKLVSGLQCLGAQNNVGFWGLVNGNFWFITVLLCLYLIYPAVSLAFKKNPHITIAAMFAVAIANRIIMANAPQYFMGIYWNPLCWLPEFTLGIYLIKRGFYPKKQSSRALAFLGNLSFYIYLINQPIMQSFHLAENIPLFGAVLFGFSVLLYLLDKKIQTLISRRLKKPKPPSALQ